MRKQNLRLGALLLMAVLGTMPLTYAGKAGRTAARSMSAGTRFTYQGLLKQDGVPVGVAGPVTCEFIFTLWDDAGNGDPPIGGIQIIKKLCEGGYYHGIECTSDANCEDTRYDGVCIASNDGSLKCAGGVNDGQLCANAADCEDALPNGLCIPTSPVSTSVTVTNGLFTAELNGNGEFGRNAFDGSARWVEIAVRCPQNSPRPTTTLSSRQSITAAPYALHAHGTTTVFNIRDFGAVGDGDTDDTEAIRVAINAARGGGIVFFPPGVYRVTDTLSVTSASREPGIILRGSGTGAIDAVIIPSKRAHATIILADFDGDLFQSAAFSGVVLEDMALVDGFEARTVGAAVHTIPNGDGNTRLLMENVFVQGFYDGIQCVRPILTTFKNVTVNSPQRTGFRIESDANGAGTSTVFENCLARGLPGPGNPNVEQDGYLVDGASYVSFLGCAADGNDRDGYRITRLSTFIPTAVSFRGCGAEGNSEHGFFIDKAQGVEIAACHASQNGEDGIHVALSRAVSVVSPYVNNNGGESIGLVGAVGVVVLDPQMDGIVQYDSATAVIVLDEGNIDVQGRSTVEGNINAESNITAGIDVNAVGNVSAGIEFRISGTRVVGDRKLGWVAPTGIDDRSTFDTENVSTVDLARRMKALIDDLTQHGLIGQ